MRLMRWTWADVHWMQRAALLCLIMVITTMSWVIAFAQAETASGSKITELRSGWLYKEGVVLTESDDPNTWTDIEDLEKLNLPVETGKETRYTFKITLPESDCASCAISLNPYTRVYDVYWNGEKIGSAGGGVGTPATRAEKPPLMIHLPDRSDDANIMIVTDQQHRSFAVRAPVYYGEPEAILDRLWQDQKTQLIIATFVLMIGLIAFMLFFSLEKDASFLHLGTAATVIGLYLLSTCSVITQLFGNPVVWEYFNYLFRYSMPIVVWWYFRDFVIPNQWVDRIIFGGNGLFLAVASGAQFAGLPLYNWANENRMIYFLSLGLAMYWMIVSFRRGHRQTAEALIPFGILIVITALNNLMETLRITNLDLTPYCGAVFMMTQLYVLTNRFRRAKEDLIARASDLELMNAKLREMDKIKDSILSNTSHELRTPLNGMIGIAGALIGVDDMETKQRDEFLHVIVRSGYRLNDMVTQILDFQSVHRGNMKLYPQMTDLNAMTGDVLKLIQPLLKDPSIRLINEVPEGLNVFADEQRLFQMMNHLIGNAAKFTARGQITVRADLEGSMHAIRIIDTGIGIEPSQMNRIFHLFEQGDIRTEREAGGVGIGLPLSRKLAELHGGRLEAQSEPGNGSVFTLYLPAGEREAESVALIA